MNVETLLDLYNHMAWADAEVWTSVLNCGQACQDGRLRDILHHLHVAQRAYLRTWRGESLDAPYPHFDDTPALCEWAKTYYGQARGYLEALTDAQAREAVPVAWAQRMERLLGRAPAPTTLGETAMQVCLHSLYHRGQVNARLRELGGTPSLVDYIAWVLFGRPAPAWPVVTDEAAPH